MEKIIKGLDGCKVLIFMNELNSKSIVSVFRLNQVHFRFRKKKDGWGLSLPKTL